MVIIAVKYLPTTYTLITTPRYPPISYQAATSHFLPPYYIPPTYSVLTYYLVNITSLLDRGADGRGGEGGEGGGERGGEGTEEEDGGQVQSDFK